MCRKNFFIYDNQRIYATMVIQHSHEKQTNKLKNIKSKQTESTQNLKETSHKPKMLEENLPERDQRSFWCF